MENCAKLREHIIKHGAYSSEKNAEIYEVWFARSPRYLFREVDRAYGISRKLLCDIGCAYGQNLPHCREGSYGIEIDAERAEFIRSIGYQVYEHDVDKDDISHLPPAEVVWCSAVLEHMESPYGLLRKIYDLLQSGGLVVLYVPVIPVWSFLEKAPGLGRYVTGYDRPGHVHAFVPSTLRYLCEQAGFITLKVSPCYPGFFRIFEYLPWFNRLTGRCIYVGRKDFGRNVR